MLYSLTLLFLSFVASPSLFVNRFEKLREFYDSVSLYRAVIGVGYLIFGILDLIEVLFHFFSPVRFLTAICVMVLGFLLGFQWITENIFSTNFDMQDKLKGVYIKLAPYEAFLSMVVLVLAIYHFICWI